MDTARGYDPLESQATVRFTIVANDLEEADAIADAKLRGLLKLPQERSLNLFYKRTIFPNKGMIFPDEAIEFDEGGEWVIDYEVVL